MPNEHVNAEDGSSASVVYGPGATESVQLCGRFDVNCVGPVEHRRAEYIILLAHLVDAEACGDVAEADRLAAQLSKIPMEEKWAEVINNLVTTVGKNDLLDKYLGGSSYTQTIVMGLKGTGTAVIGDTQSSHAAWNEQGLANAPTYTGNRKVPAFSAAAAGVKSTSSAVAFAITSSGTVFGCFINNGGSATKDDTTGVLFSAGDFSGGSKPVGNGDTINVSYSLSV